MNRETIDEIKKNAKATISRFGARDRMLQRYRDIYFLDNIEQPRNSEIDEGDWKLTPSPSGRNEVVGMQRLLNTSEFHITIKDDDDVKEADEIEEGLKAVLRVSGEGRRSRIESDAALSAVLYGAVTVYAESIADLLQIKTLTKYKRDHLTKKQKRSPFLLRLINTEESYPEWDEDMMIAHSWRYKIRGANLKARWGTKDAQDNNEYMVYDVFTPEFHVVWADGLNGEILAAEHGLGCLPIFTAYAGGSDLFHKPEEQMQSFLYAKAKANLDKRENSLLTTLFTNIHQRGTAGPLIALDPDNLPSTITVSYQGGMRYITAKAQQIDDKIIDPVIFQAKGLLDELSGQSTIQRQTLGENMGSGVPFSSLAMLSNSGKLPLVDPQRALEQVFTDAFNHILYRIKTEVIENEQISPADITDEMEIEVSLQAKLPQDSLRNAQISNQTGDLMSEEWKRTELLGISNNDDMQKQILKEQMKKAIFAAMMQNPQVIQQAVGAIMGQPQQQQGQPDPNAQQPDPAQMEQAQAEAQMQGQGQPSPEQLQAMIQQGQGGMSGMGNMEGQPMTDSMIPPQERMA